MSEEGRGGGAGEEFGGEGVEVLWGRSGVVASDGKDGDLLAGFRGEAAERDSSTLSTI